MHSSRDFKSLRPRVAVEVVVHAKFRIAAPAELGRNLRLCTIERLHQPSGMRHDVATIRVVDILGIFEEVEEGLVIVFVTKGSNVEHPKRCGYNWMIKYGCEFLFYSLRKQSANHIG